MEKVRKIILVSSLSLGGLLVAFFVYIAIALSLHPGMDHYRYVGDGKKHEFIMVTTLSLHDIVNSIPLAGDINKYMDVYPYLYVVGDSYGMSGTTEDGITYYYNQDPNTGEWIMYEDVSEIPQYMIINYETMEVFKYLNLEDMPEEDQAIFNEPVTEKCLQDKTCYDAR